MHQRLEHVAERGGPERRAHRAADDLVATGRMLDAVDRATEECRAARSSHCPSSLSSNTALAREPGRTWRRSSRWDHRADRSPSRRFGVVRGRALRHECEARGAEAMMRDQRGERVGAFTCVARLTHAEHEEVDRSRWLPVAA